MSTNHDGPRPNLLQQRHAERMSQVDPAAGYADAGAVPKPGHLRPGEANMRPVITEQSVDSSNCMSTRGYEALGAVLMDAYNQASHGKGKERHAREDEKFTDQLIIEGAKRFGIGSLLFQAYKKSEESQRLEYHRARAELLGAIVYLAAAVIALDLREAPGK